MRRSRHETGHLLHPTPVVAPHAPRATKTASLPFASGPTGHAARGCGAHGCAARHPDPFARDRRDPAPARGIPRRVALVSGARRQGCCDLRERTAVRSRRSNGETRDPCGAATRGSNDRRACAWWRNPCTFARRRFRLERPLPGHIMNLTDMRRSAVRRRSGIRGIVAAHRVDNRKCVKTPFRREVWKATLLRSPSPYPGRVVSPATSDGNPSPRTGYPPVWKGLVE
jgi:hypothetical protein